MRTLKAWAVILALSTSFQALGDPPSHTNLNGGFQGGQYSPEGRYYASSEPQLSRAQLEEQWRQQGRYCLSENDRIGRWIAGRLWCPTVCVPSERRSSCVASCQAGGTVYTVSRWGMFSCLRASTGLLRGLDGNGFAQCCQSMSFR